MSKELVKTIVRALDSKKAKEIQVIDISEVSQMADYFVICSGTSSTHVKSLADEVEFKVGEDAKDIGFHREGYSSASWILLDYKDVIVHIFYGETRDFYNLEHLWADGEKKDIAEFLEGEDK